MSRINWSLAALALALAACAAAGQEAEFTVRAAAPPPETLPETGPVEADPLVDCSAAPPRRDWEGRVWRVACTESGTARLMMWTGTRWCELPMSSPFHPQHFSFAFDSAGRVWTGNPVASHEVLVGTPVTENPLGDISWRRYATLQAALDALFTPGTRFAPGPAPSGSAATGWGRWWGGNALIEGRDGLLAYRTEDRVAVRTGGAWREWSTAELLGVAESVTVPHVWKTGEDGMPVIGTLKAEARLTPGMTWEKTRVDAAPEAPRGCGSRINLDPDTDGPTVTAANDRDSQGESIPFGGGVVWRRTPSGLRREGHGLGRTLVPGERLRLIQDKTLADILPSPCGMVFLVAKGPKQEHWSLVGSRGFALHSETPRTLAAVEPAGDATLRLHFSSTGDDRIFHTWRVDGGAWECATDASEAVTGPLPQGMRRVEIRAVSEWVAADPETLVVEAEAALDPEFMRRWLDALAGDDPVLREKAAASLAALGAEALPELEALRARTTEADPLWWVEAAIEGARRNMGTTH